MRKRVNQHIVVPVLVMLSACSLGQGTALAIETCTPIADQKVESTRTLVPEREPGPGERLYLRITIGSLPARASLIACDLERRQLAALSPFGALARQNGGSYLLPFPAGSYDGGKLELTLQLEQEGQPVRAPSSEELKTVELVVVPVNE